MNFPVRDLLVVTFLFAILSSCKKDGFTTSPTAYLRASEDSIHFDTVFTSTGSSSRQIKLLNDNDEGLRISSIRLAGGATSPFKINVDGVPGPLVKHLELAGRDSLYLFATVSIDPSAANLPFIIRDSIEVRYNEKVKWIQLDAFGLNAHFLRNKVVSTNEVWTNDRPYVILGSLTINENASLTVNEGCHLYIHADAPILVKGTLRALGDKYDSTRVIFTGDRLDDPYRFFPASFPGLIFTSTSQNNLLRYAIIQSAYQGVVVTGPSPSPRLDLQQTIIDNAYDAGMIGLNTNISASNLLISNCGKNLLLAEGGTYDFNHCTIASVTTNYIQHRNPVFYISNFLDQNGTVTTNPLTAVFNNCIFWGEANGFVDNEVIVARSGSGNYAVQFKNILWRISQDPQFAQVSGTNLKNADPVFDSLNINQRIFSFRLGPTSPALNVGGPTGLTIDLDGKTRPVGLPDLGAYEKQ